MLLLLPLLWAGSLAQGAEFQLQVPRSVMVQEGLCALVPCNVTYPKRGWTDSTPALGYWFRQGAETLTDPPVATNNPDRKVQNETQGRFHLVGDPRNYSCSLYIRDARKRDTETYIFRVERGTHVKYNYIQDQLSVHVTGLTPDIHIQGTLQSGHPNNITCMVPWSCEREMPPTFFWFGVSLTSLGPMTPSSSVVTLTPGPQDHGSNLTCRVTFQGGMVRERTIQLNVSYTLQNLTVSMSQTEGTEPKAVGNGSSLQVQEGQFLRLVCEADSFPPTRTSWARGSLTLNSSEPGVLELRRVELEDHGKYVCRAQGEQTSLEVSLSLLVRNPPELLAPSCSWEDEALHCCCSSRAQPAPSLSWRLGEWLLEGNISNASYTVTSHSAGSWNNSSLGLSEGLSVGFSAGLRLSCEARNAHGEQTVTVLLLPGRPGHKTGVIQGAIGGAGVTALLAVCLCVIILKIYRKKSTERAECQEGIYESHLNESSSDHPLPVPAPSTSEELYYAALSFHNMKPLNLQPQETTTYSEIKIQK